MALTAAALAEEVQGALEEDGISIPLRTVKEVLGGLAQVAEEQIAAGDDFTIPGIAKLVYTYTPASKKGDRWKKGEEVVGFGGVASVKEADSPARKAKIKLVARPTGAVAKRRPGSKPEVQAAFLKSKAGKRVAARKSK
jgi:hypothetical protein